MRTPASSRSDSRQQGPENHTGGPGSADGHSRLGRAGSRQSRWPAAGQGPCGAPRTRISTCTQVNGGTSIRRVGGLPVSPVLLSLNMLQLLTGSTPLATEVATPPNFWANQSNPPQTHMTQAEPIRAFPRTILTELSGEEPRLLRLCIWAAYVL